MALYLMVKKGVFQVYHNDLCSLVASWVSVSQDHHTSPQRTGIPVSSHVYIPIYLLLVASANSAHKLGCSSLQVTSAAALSLVGVWRVCGLKLYHGRVIPIMIKWVFHVTSYVPIHDQTR